jgi:hypothetical protein
MLWILVSLLGCKGDKNEDDSGGGDDGNGDDSTPIGVDDDGDGYETPEDCDDANENVNPDATEVCDGIDNDCDNLIDDGDDSFEGGVTVFTDSDGDGYGDDKTERQACDEGVGTTDVAGDCDDADSAINPDALELCDDKLDSNCDDDPDYNCVGTTDNAYAIWAGKGEGDDLGLDVAARGDLNGDGTPDVIVGARENDDHGTDAGEAYVLFGPLQSGDFSVDSADGEIYGAAGSKLGRSSEFVGDMGGDKGEDIALSAPTLTRVGGTNAGRVYLIEASAITKGSTDVATIAWAQLEGGTQFDYAGTDIQRGGDVDGDGAADIWIGIAGDDDGATLDAGSVVLVAGPVSGTTSLDAQAAKLIGVGSSHGVGSALAPGDYDGDGLGDIAIGDASEGAGGVVYVVLGPVTGSVPLSSADVEISSDGTSEAFGTSIANGGDTNGDGLDDLLVGVPWSEANDSGEALLLETPLKTGAAASATVATFVGSDASAEVGYSVAADHDIDGDANGDVLIGSPAWGDGRGAAYLLAGPFSGAVELDTASQRWWVGPEDMEGHVGDNVAFGGPALEGGGEAILLPTPRADDGALEAGSLYVEAF